MLTFQISISHKLSPDNIRLFMMQTQKTTSYKTNVVDIVVHYPEMMRTD